MRCYAQVGQMDMSSADVQETWAGIRALSTHDVKVRLKQTMVVSSDASNADAKRSQEVKWDAATGSSMVKLCCMLRRPSKVSLFWQTAAGIVTPLCCITPVPLALSK